MQQYIDVKCIKQEYQEEYNVPEYELDIGPVKIEEHMNTAIKQESDETQQTLNSCNYADFKLEHLY